MNENILKVIKAQIKYIIYNLQGTVIIFTGMILYSYFREFNPLNILSFLIFVQYVTLVVLNNSKENRDITFRLLTLSAKELAITRIILVFIGFVTIYLIACGLNYLIFDTGNYFRDGYHELFMFGGIGLLGIFLYLLISDYFTIFRRKSGYIIFNITTAIIIGIIGFSIIFSVKSVYDSSISSSTWLIVSLYICSIVFAVFSLFTYQNRESHLGYK